MKRLLLLLVALGLAGAAALVDPPADLDPQISSTTTVAAGEEQVSRFYHCPWAFADGVTDTAFALVTTASTDYRLSLPMSGEDEVVDEARAAPHASVGIGLSGITAIGAVSAIIEFEDGPAAAGVVASADQRIAGDACPSALPAVWHAVGGSTREGERLTLRLFNPFADAARITLSLVSELGSEAVAGFEAITVPARTTRTVELAELLPGRDTLSVFVEQLEGSVIPALVQEGGGDLAMWPAVRQSESWELPLISDRGMDGAIVLTNSALVPVAYSVDVFDEQATVTTPVEGEIAGPGQVTIPLDRLSSGVAGARVSGDGPFSAVVVGSSETGRAATPASPRTSTAWLLPGVNVQAGVAYRMWVLNTGVDMITLTYQAVDATGGSPGVEKLDVAAGAVASVDVGALGTAGLIVEANGPFSAAWSAANGSALGYFSGVPIGD